MTTSTNHHHLPEDILIDVLLHLPAKCLTRFTCTCKSWYALIKGNHTFILNHQHLNPGYNLLLYEVQPYDLDNRRLTFISNTDTTLDPNLHHAIQDYKVELSAHCNGILCLYQSVSGKGILWNPAIRETRVLPLFPHDYTKKREWYCLRLGYDKKLNDYKVLVFSMLDCTRDPWCTEVKQILEADLDKRLDIYSMRSDSWRRFKGNVPFYPWGPTIKCMDGVVYWFSATGKSTHNILLSFYIGVEVFEEIAIPDSIIDPLANSELGKYNDHVALLYSEYMVDLYGMRFEIWVLLSKSCWNKVLTFGPFTHLNLFPLAFSEHDDKVILNSCTNDEPYTECLRIYDPQSQQFNDPGIHGYGFQGIPYKESLVSVKRVPQDFSEVINIANLFN
ncbi:hypothetical protein ACFE04_031414 [Oxalis oulophora]